MRLTQELIPAWVKWQKPDGSAAELSEAVASLSVRAEPELLARRLLALDAEGRIEASLSLSLFQPGVLSFASPRGGPDTAPKVYIGLVEDALATAREQGFRLQCRLPESPAFAPLQARLPMLGARLSHRRVEYWAPLSELPDESGSPLSWQALAPSGPYRLAEAAELLRAAGQGDPDWDPEDDAEALLQAYLADEALTSGPDCVQIGHLDGQPAGIVIAQVNPANGWSRLTYLGLLPAFRGQGLGKWVQRRGFAMLRAQGGREYHGGTVAGNAAMEALFRSQGCRLERVLQEWHWDRV